jgi:hypothetical protein
LEDEDGEKPEEDESIELHDDWDPDEDEILAKNSEKLSSDKQSKDKNERISGERVDEGGDTEMCVEVDGDKVETLGAARGNETTFHTALGDVASDAAQLELMSADSYHTMRSELENQLATWSQVSMKADLQFEYACKYNKLMILHMFKCYIVMKHE